MLNTIIPNYCSHGRFVVRCLDFKYAFFQSTCEGRQLIEINLNHCNVVSRICELYKPINDEIQCISVCLIQTNCWDGDFYIMSGITSDVINE